MAFAINPRSYTTSVDSICEHQPHERRQIGDFPLFAHNSMCASTEHADYWCVKAVRARSNAFCENTPCVQSCSGSKRLQTLICENDPISGACSGSKC